MLNKFFDFILTNTGEIITLFTAIGTVTLSIIQRMSKTERIKSFNRTVTQLSSTNIESQLSAAILLRRYLSQKHLLFFKPILFDEAINVISALLRTLPTGIYQKTLCDGLAYAIHKKGLSNMDLQKTNLQQIYFGNKKHRIHCHETDFYMADLSYSLIENVDGKKAIFYNAIFLSAKIKFCNFENANFIGADLSNTKFKEVRLFNANFSKAINVPAEILCNLNEKGIYTNQDNFTSPDIEECKKVFFSMPGIMTKEDRHVVESYKESLIKRGFEVKEYQRDNYPKFGQLNNIRCEMNKVAGIIAFGFKQINISSGSYRCNTIEVQDYSGKWLSTPWSEIEVGMAIALGRPILLIHDKEVTEGVFDPILSEYFVGSISTDIDIAKIDTNKTFDSWVKML